MSMHIAIVSLVCAMVTVAMLLVLSYVFYGWYIVWPLVLHLIASCHYSIWGNSYGEGLYSCSIYLSKIPYTLYPCARTKIDCQQNISKTATDIDGLSFVSPMKLCIDTLCPVSNKI